MLRRNLLRRFMPIALSVAMVFQSMPATALAAETTAETAVEETTDGGVPSDEVTENGGTDGSAAEESAEPVSSAQEAAEESVEPVSSAQELEEIEDSKVPDSSEIMTEIVSEEKTEETSVADNENDSTEAAAKETEVTVSEDAALQTVISINKDGLKSEIGNYGLTYNDSGVVSGVYNETNLFDDFINGFLKDSPKAVFSVEIDGKANDRLCENLKFQWKALNADGTPADIPAGETTPKTAGTYRLVITLDAVDGLCKAAEAFIDFEIRKATLDIDLSEVEKPAFGSKITEFEEEVKEAFLLRSGQLAEALNKDVYVESAVVTVKDAVTGEAVPNEDKTAVFEQGKDYSYTIEVKLHDSNYEVADIGVQDIVPKGEIEAEIKVTLLKNIEYQYGAEEPVSFPVAGTDYTVEVLTKADGKPVEIENPVITAAWLDGDGKELGKDETPKNAGRYKVRLTFTDATGRYKAEPNEEISIKINPVSVYIKPMLPKTEFAAGMKETDILKNVSYSVFEIGKESAKWDKKKAESETETLWGVSYNAEKKAQIYEPVFKLQYAELSQKDGAPVKDAEGKPVYGAWKDNEKDRVLDGSTLDGINCYQYRIVFSGKKGVRNGKGVFELENLVSINDRGTNSADMNVKVDDTLDTTGDNAVAITVVSTTATIDISAYDKDAKEKIYDGKPFTGYETRNGYKKAKVSVSAGELSYEWYERVDTRSYVDDNGQEQIEDIWAEDPSFSFNVTRSDGSTDTSFSPVAAGKYKLVISYEDPAGVNTAADQEIIYTIYQQKVKAEIATGTEDTKFTTYSGIQVSEFIKNIKDTITKSVKTAKDNNLSVSGEELNWEYDEDYGFLWFVERKDKLTGEWVAVEKTEGFFEGYEYRLNVGVDIMPDYTDQSAGHYDNYYDDNYQSYDETKDGKEYYRSNDIAIAVEKMGTVPIAVTVDSEKIADMKKKYDGKAIDISAVEASGAISVVNKNTGNLIPEFAGLKFVWKDLETGQMVDPEDAVNAGEYELYAYFEGNTTYAPLAAQSDGSPKIADAEITPFELVIAPFVNEEFTAGRYDVEALCEGVHIASADGDDIPDYYDFTGHGWIDEDGNSHEGYKAFAGEKDFTDETLMSTLAVYTADGKILEGNVLKSNTEYYAVFGYIPFNPSYDYRRNYKLTRQKTFFTPIRGNALVQRVWNGNEWDIQGTSIKDAVEGTVHTITPREGIAYSYKKVQDKNGKEIDGNFLVFQIQAPAEFFTYDTYYDENGEEHWYRDTFTGSIVCENSIEAIGGYVLELDGGVLQVAFKVTEENKKMKPEELSFKVRWEDGYVEEFRLNLADAVLEADLKKAVAPKSLSFNSPATKMVIGEKQQLDVKITKKKLDDIICLRYEAEDKDVLSVSETGAVVALTTGRSKVTAIPYYLDEDGNKIDITGKGVPKATVTINVKDVTAPKIKSVTALDTKATVTYPELADGYRREIYIAEGKLNLKAMEDKVDSIVNGDWRTAGFAIAPMYSGEVIDHKTGMASVKVENLTAGQQYTVYVRNVSGIRTLADGKPVVLSAKGDVKSFKTTLSQVKGLKITFDKKYWDDVNGNWKVSILDKKIPSITEGMFSENANPENNANEFDKIWYKLPFEKSLGLTKYYAQPKLSYYVTNGTDYAAKQNGVYTLKIGSRYYQPTTLASVDKKGNITLKGVGTVYVWVYDAVMEQWAWVRLTITADANKWTLPKSAKVKVGSSIQLESLATFYQDKKKLPGFTDVCFEITDQKGDVDSFEVKTGVGRNQYTDTYFTTTYVIPKEAGKSIELTVAASVVPGARETAQEATIKITSSDIDAVKGLKVSEIVDRYATYSFTYPVSMLPYVLTDSESTFEMWDDSDTEKLDQLYFRIRVLDSEKNIVSDQCKTFAEFYNGNSERFKCEYNPKKKVCTFTGVLEGLNRKSGYTISVTAVYRDQAAKKAANKSFKTTDIPAAYQYQYDPDYWYNNGEGKWRGFYSSTTDAYKTDDGGICIAIGNSVRLDEYPALASNNTYTLVAHANNPEAKSRLSDTLTWKSANPKVATVKANAGSYTATLKALKKGTTQIEVTSKITKKVIARWTVIVNATGEGSYYFGDWEPDENNTLVGGIEYGEDELLTVDNAVKVKLAPGEGVRAKFVAPAYGEYQFFGAGRNIRVYTLNENGEYRLQEYYTLASRLYSLKQGEIYYIIAENHENNKDVTVTISAKGTIYKVLTMDGYKKADNSSETMVFTAPEDNVYTFKRDNKTVLKTIDLKAGEEYPFLLPVGNYEVSVSKRNPEKITAEGVSNVSVAAGETKWYVFTAPAAMDYAFASTAGMITLYDAITEVKSSIDETTVSMEKDKKLYISVKNTGAAAITANVTVTPEAVFGTAIDVTKTTTTDVKLTEAGKQYFVQLTIPEDGYYRIKTTATVAEAAAKAAAPSLIVSRAEDTKGTNESIIGLTKEVPFTKDQVVYISIKSDTANTDAKLAVTKITPVELPVTNTTIGSDNSYFKFTAKTGGIYTFKATVAPRKEGETPTTPKVAFYNNQNKEFETGITQFKMDAGEVKYLRVSPNDDAKTDTASISVTELKPDVFTATWEAKLAKDEERWIEFKAAQDTIYTFKAEVKPTKENTGRVEVWQSDTFGKETDVLPGNAPDSTYYRVGGHCYLKIKALDGEVTYTITAAPITFEGNDFTVGKSSEKWFRFTAPVTARYSVNLTGADLANISYYRWDLRNNKWLDSTSEVTLTAGQTVYYKIQNTSTDKDKAVKFSLTQVSATALDTNEGGKNSDTVSLANGASVWYSFKAPAGGRYSFSAQAAGTDGSASMQYYKALEGGEMKTGVNNPEHAVFLKANETVYVKVTANTSAKSVSVTTSVKAIITTDITAADSAHPVEKAVANAVAGSYTWYELNKPGTYTITFSGVTENGSYQAWYVKNDDPILREFTNSNPKEFTLEDQDVVTIAVCAQTDKLDYKITSQIRDIKPLSLGDAGAVSASLKSGDELYVSFKVPERDRYAVYVSGLADGDKASIEQIGPEATKPVRNYYSFVASANETVTMKVTVSAKEATAVKVMAETVADRITDISQTGSAAIDKEKPVGYMSWFAYTPVEDGKFLMKSSAAGVEFYVILGEDYTDFLDESSLPQEVSLEAGRTYYYAACYTAKPEQQANVTIAKAKANVLAFKDGKQSASLEVDVAKVAAGEKYYVSFTAPEDGRYLFNYATEGKYTLSGYCYNDVDDMWGGDVSYYGSPYELPLRKGETLIFATSYTGAADKNYTIQVEKNVPIAVKEAGKDEPVKIPGNQAKYAAITASKTCDVTVTIAPVAENDTVRSVYYEILNDIVSKKINRHGDADSNTPAEVKITIPAGTTRYVRLENKYSSDAITVNVKYTEGQDLTALVTGSNTVEAGEEGRKVVYFTAEEEGIYSFEHSGKADAVQVQVNGDSDDIANRQWSDVYLAKGDTAVITLLADKDSGEHMIIVTKTADVKVMEPDKEATLALNEDRYAYIRINPGQTGGYVLSMERYCEIYEKDTEMYYSGQSVVFNLDAGESTVYKIHDYNGSSDQLSMTAALSYIGEVVQMETYEKPYRLKVNKGEVKYVSLSGLVEGSDIYRFSVSATNGISADYLEAIDSNAEELGSGTELSFAKRPGYSSYLRITGKADATEVSIRADWVDNQLYSGWNEGLDLHSDKEYTDYLYYCNSDAYYYFNFKGIQKIAILHGNGNVKHTVVKDEQGISWSRYLNRGTYTIRIWSDAKADEETRIEIQSYIQWGDVRNVPYSTYVFLDTYQHRRINFIAPESGTYQFYSWYYEWDDVDSYASLYDNTGKQLAYNDDIGLDNDDYNYNFSISWDLETGEQVQLRTSFRDNDEMSGGYYVYIRKVESTEE